MTKEEIFTQQVKPILARALDVCIENKISFLMNFHLGGGLHSNTFLLMPENEATQVQIEAASVLMAGGIEGILQAVVDKAEVADMFARRESDIN